MATNNGVNTSLSGQTGTVSFVGSTSPTLVTPVLGAATATSVNFGGSTLSTYVKNGSWTPVFTFSTIGNLSVVYTTQLGTYSQIGNIVVCAFNLAFTPTFTTSAGQILITGLPATVNTTQTNPGACYFNAVVFPANYTNAVATPGINTTQMNFVTYGSNQALTTLGITATPSGAAYIINGSLTYLAT